MGNRYSQVLQQSEEDCGAACLAMVARHYGQLISLNASREAVGTGQLGTTLLGLQRGAEGLGFNARTLKASPLVLDRMDQVQWPAIIHWQGNHWVVLYGKRGRQFVVADPALGLRYLTREQVAAGWQDGVVLLLEPDAVRFTQGVATTHQSQQAPQGWARVGRQVWSQRSLLLQMLPLSLSLGLLSLSLPFLLQILTDDVLLRGDTRLLALVAIAVVLTHLVSAALGFIQAHLVTHFAQRLELGLMLDFGRQLLRLPLTYFEARRSGEVVSRLQDIQEINQLMSQGVVELPTQLFVALVSLGLMLVYSWKLTLLSVASALVMTFTTVLALPTLRRKTQQMFATEAENQGVLVEIFKGALTLKSLTAKPQFWEELQHRFGRFANLSLDTLKIGILNHSFSSLIAALSGVLLLVVGGLLVISPSEHFSIGQLMAFNAMHQGLLGFFSRLIEFADEFLRASTATSRLSEVIDATAEQPTGPAKPLVQLDPTAMIACNNVHFHYPGRLELLQNFQLEIPGGQVVALIGRSGCGKSSLAKLLAGLYPIQSGNIRIGAFSLADIDLDCLRQQVMLVPQEAHFWSRSILDNFHLGDPHLPFEAIAEACQITGADEFIQRLPERYQTVLGEFGANLSGGQRQRLAIARALALQPPILILDESTSGLDPASEAELLDQVLEARAGATTLLISHRPKVINRADWIVHLDQGQVSCEGHPMELRARLGSHREFLLA